MGTIVFQGLVGLSVAMYLWLISAGLTIIFGVLGIVNFAHGSLFMLGAYFAYTAYGLLGLPFWAAIALALLGVGLVGLALERGLLRHLYGVDEADGRGRPAPEPLGREARVGVVPGLLVG